jgi:hypothetical protein
MEKISTVEARHLSRLIVRTERALDAGSLPAGPERPVAKGLRCLGRPALVRGDEMPDSIEAIRDELIDRLSLDDNAEMVELLAEASRIGTIEVLLRMSFRSVGRGAADLRERIFRIYRGSAP